MDADDDDDDAAAADVLSAGVSAFYNGNSPDSSESAQPIEGLLGTALTADVSASCHNLQISSVSHALSKPAPFVTV